MNPLDYISIDREKNVLVIQGQHFLVVDLGIDTDYEYQEYFGLGHRGSTRLLTDTRHTIRLDVRAVIPPPPKPKRTVANTLGLRRPK